MTCDRDFLHIFSVWTVPVCLLRIRGELAIGAHLRATDLYTVGSFDPDHDAVMRIGSELSRALRGGLSAFEAERVLLQLLILFIELVVPADVGLVFPLREFNPLEVRPYLLDCKQAPDTRDKSRKLSRELRVCCGSISKIQQFLCDEIIERRPQSVAPLDFLSRFALLNPNFVKFPRFQDGSFSIVLLRDRFGSAGVIVNLRPNGADRRS